MLITRELTHTCIFFTSLNNIFPFHPILNNVSQNIKVHGEVYHFVNGFGNITDTSLKQKIFTFFQSLFGIKGKDFCHGYPHPLLLDTFSF